MEISRKGPEQDAGPAESLPERPMLDPWTWLPDALGGGPAMLAALAVTAAALTIAKGLGTWLPEASVALVFLMAIIMAAVALGIRTGLAVGVLSSLAYNFFFIPPIYTLSISDPRELLAFIVFMAVALLTGSLAGRMRVLAEDARARATSLQTLNEFAARLSATREAAPILEAIARQAAESTRGHALVLKPVAADEPGEDGLAVAVRWPADSDLETADWQTAHRAWRAQAFVPGTAEGWPGGRLEFYPITTAQGPVGVLGVKPAERARHGEDRPAIEAAIRHAVIALERVRLEDEARRARSETERERLRSALLASLSHDLRTPLASILGAVTSLRELGHGMTAEMQQDLLAEIEEETGRLGQFVSNLLQMTRLEAGGIDLRSDWIDAGDALRSAVARARKLAPAARIVLDCPAHVPTIRGEGTLLEHVLFNLIENGIKFSAEAPHVEVRAEVEPGGLRIEVADNGRGIPAEAQGHIFEPFYRVKGGDGDVPGTGLGLAIAQRIVQGMGGSIRARSPINGERGTLMTVRLPTAGQGGAPTQAMEP